MRFPRFQVTRFSPWMVTPLTAWVTPRQSPSSRGFEPAKSRSTWPGGNRRATTATQCTRPATTATTTAFPRATRETVELATGIWKSMNNCRTKQWYFSIFNKLRNRPFVLSKTKILWFNVCLAVFFIYFIKLFSCDKLNFFYNFIQCTYKVSPNISIPLAIATDSP